MPTLTVRKQQDIGAMLRAAREDSGLSQEDLASKLGFSRDYMLDIESGKPNLFASRLLRVMHELGITMTLSYEDDDART